VFPGAQDRIISMQKVESLCKAFVCKAIVGERFGGGHAGGHKGLRLTYKSSEMLPGGRAVGSFASGVVSDFRLVTRSGRPRRIPLQSDPDPDTHKGPKWGVA